jgi:hypothetical protein
MTYFRGSHFNFQRPQVACGADDDDDLSLPKSYRGHPETLVSRSGVAWEGQDRVSGEAGTATAASGVVWLCGWR